MHGYAVMLYLTFGVQCICDFSRLSSFPQETQLWNEVTHMAEALESEMEDEKNTFYKGMHV